MGRFAVIVLCSAVILVAGFGQFGLCGDDYDRIMRTTLGGYRDRGTLWNSVDVETLARFAVQEHNQRENELLEFSRVLKAREQTVAGRLYHLTLEVTKDGNKKIYNAKVWVKPWMNFKRLEEFKPVELTSAPLEFDVKQDGNESPWRAVSANNVEVQDAANHAVNSIQKRSNSLYPYRLLQILLARTKVLEDSVKFDLLLKMCRGDKQETSRVEVTKKHDGKFY